MNLEKQNPKKMLNLTEWKIQMAFPFLYELKKSNILLGVVACDRNPLEVTEGRALWVEAIVYIENSRAK